MNEQQQIDRIDTWAVVELMGHTKRAGRVTEESHFGASVLRVDVPQTSKQLAFTTYYTAGAIYSVTPCTEGVARAVAEEIGGRPITVYGRVLPERQLPDTVQQGLPMDGDGFEDEEVDEW